MVSAQIIDDTVNQPCVDDVGILDRPQKQCARGQLIDASWNTAGRAVQRHCCCRTDFRPPVPSDNPKAMFEIGKHFVRTHAIEVVRGDDALAQLLQLRRGQPLAKFGLPEQQDLEQRAAARLEVRQHPQLFEGRNRQVLGLVDDEQCLATFPRAINQIAFDPVKQLRLGHTLGRDVERLRGKTQDIVALDLSRDELDHGNTRRIEPFH